MSEKDPYAQKRKDSSDESRMDNEMTNDANPDRPQTNKLNEKEESEEDSNDTMET